MNLFKKTSIAILVALIFGEILLISFGVSTSSLLASLAFWQDKNLENYAEKIVQKCSDKKNPDCYRKEIPALMNKLSMEEAFQVTKEVQNLDPEYYYCHVLGHELSAVETAKDPSQWKEVVSSCPRGLCSNGCIHGAFQERFRASSLPEASVSRVADELENLCVKREGWNPTGLERATCYHALGHLTMYVTDAEEEKASKICDEVVRNRDKSESFLPLCYDGVFMQLFQPLEPEDFALVEGKVPEKNNHKEFCWRFDGYKRSSCWSEGWPMYRKEIKNPDFLVDYCNTLNSERHVDRCFNGLFYVLTLQFRFKQHMINSFCSELPIKRSGQCFANAASRMIETDYRNMDKAVELCNAIETDNEQKDCFEELLTYSTYNYKPGSKEAMELCKRMPEPWNNKCEERQVRFSKNKPSY